MNPNTVPFCSGRRKRSLVIMAFIVVGTGIWCYQVITKGNVKIQSEILQNFRSKFKQINPEVFNEEKNVIGNAKKLNVLKFEEIKKCEPHTKYAFIKTHKTGSTTLKHIFLNFEKKHGVKQAAKLRGYPGHVRPEFIFTQNNSEPDVLVPVKKGDDFVVNQHFRFNATALREVMQPGTIFISVVRQPWIQFQSSFYFHYNPTVQMRKTLSTNCRTFPFVHIAQGKHISLLECFQEAYENFNPSIPWYFRCKNYQAYDLGLDALLENDEEIEKQIQKLDSEIDLMMITDYMDESLILLKEKLCWDWRDIILREGSKNVGHYVSCKLEENSDDMQKFRKMFKLDIALYRHFNDSWWKKIKKYGKQRMKNDVAKLRQLREKEIGRQTKKIRKEDDVCKLEDISPSLENSIIFSPDKYEKSHMIKVLSAKLVKENFGSKLAEEIATYMVENDGGCPI